MKLFNKSTLTAGCIAVVILNSLAFADTRIRFVRGRTSATVSGRVPTGGRVCYFAGARAGQSFSSTVSSSTGKVQIFESGDTAYSYEVETAGDQSVCVDNLGRTATYRLTVSIN
jgi:hypothetical protein